MCIFFIELKMFSFKLIILNRFKFRKTLGIVGIR